MIAKRSPIQLLYRSGLLALSTGLAGALFSDSATAVTLTLVNNGVSHECTLGSFNIGSGGAAMAEISACNPALGGSDGSVAQPPAGPVTVIAQTTTDTTPAVQGTVTLGANETFSVTLAGKTYVGGDGSLTVTGSGWTLQVPDGAALAAGTYSVIAKIANAAGGVLVDGSTNELVIQGAPSVPGEDKYGDLTKQPTTGVFIVDQSGANGAPGATIVPGCVNGGSVEYGAACRSNAIYQATVGVDKVNVSLTKGQVLSVRYRVKKDAPSAPSTGYFQLSNPIGGNIVYPTTLWLSAEAPTSQSLVPNTSPIPDAKCKIEKDTRRPRITTGSDYCKIDLSKDIYYLNIRVEQDCKSCIFTIGEGSSQLY